MRLLLDHCVDWRLSRSLPAHEVSSAHQMGWSRLKNGALLIAAARQFDALLIVDRKLKEQQDLTDLPIAVIVLVVPSNRLTDLLPLVPSIEAALKTLVPRTLIEVAATTA